MRWPWKPRPPRRRADPLRIAVLEYELFGIEPTPGTAAAFAVGMHHAFGHRDGEPVAEVTFPQGIRRSEIDTWCAVYQQTAANSFLHTRPDGTIEILYADPSGQR